MAGPPAFQFYVTDWALSVSDFTLEERGAHISLLAWSWERGPVPNDIRRIALILHVSVSVARRVWATVSGRWVLRTDEGWVHPRLERTRAEAARYAALQSERGKSGASARWNGRGNSASNAQAIAQVQPEQWPADGSPISDLRSPEDPRPSTEHSVSDLRARAGEAPVWRPPKPIPPTLREWREGETPAPLHNGAEQRRHGMHAWCGRVCVPWGLHADLQRRLGGDQADARLLAWYPAVMARYEGRELGDDLFDFWRHEFAAWVGTVTSKPVTGAKTADTMRAGATSLERRLKQIEAQEGIEHGEPPRALKG